jgi:Bacteriophage HK97-gp10, putative tail-component
VPTTPNNLANEINRLLQTYSEEVIKDIEVAANEVAKDCRKEIEYHSPHLTGTYERSWKIKKQSKKNKPLYTIYNLEYQLTHLLEHGHAKRGGGRTRAFPHIAPAEEKAIREYLKRVERAIE